MARFNRRIVSSLIAVAVLAGIALGANSATADPPTNFSVMVAPSSIPGGATSTLTETITNESTTNPSTGLTCSSPPRG